MIRVALGWIGVGWAPARRTEAASEDAVGIERTVALDLRVDPEV